MAVDEFKNTTTEDLEQMIKDITEEGERREDECRERNEEAVEMGLAYGNDPACDYVADDLWRRRDVIRAELRKRKGHTDQ